jgi:thiol-disulfide isomerase/thioredoxin
MKMRARSLIVFLGTLCGSICVGAACHAQTPAASSDLVGAVTRDQVEAAVAEWVKVETESQPSREAVQALAAVPPGAEVTVFLGTWCGDSRREMARLWRALDEVDVAGGTVPFTLRYVAVDHQKKQPADAIAASDIHYLPTLIVSRDGHEVGRIVEQSPHGVEADLLALLTGKAQGVVSASHPAEAEGAPPAAH